MKPFENALPGFNHNVKHKGQLYHVQTEDSGKHNPTVTTLLFLGGNILASLKTSYAEHLNAEELHKRVRELMEAQHKQMLRNLLKGLYDKQEALSKHWQVGELDEHDVETAKHTSIAFPEPVPLAKVDLNSPLRPSRPLPVVDALVDEAAPPPPSAASPAPPSTHLKNRPSRPLLAVMENAAQSAPPPPPPQTRPNRPSRPLPMLMEGQGPTLNVSTENEEMNAVFGENPVPEKRLDELILNYLLREKDKLS